MFYLQEFIGLGYIYMLIAKIYEITLFLILKVWQVLTQNRGFWNSPWWCVDPVLLDKCYLKGLPPQCEGRIWFQVALLLLKGNHDNFLTLVLLATGMHIYFLELLHLIPISWSLTSEKYLMNIANDAVEPMWHNHRVRHLDWVHLIMSKRAKQVQCFLLLKKIYFTDFFTERKGKG